MKKWFARRSGRCEPVENYLAEPTDAAMEIVMNCASAGPSEAEHVMKSIKQGIQERDGKRSSVALHLLSLMVLGNEAIAQAIATPKWMQRLVNLAEGTTKSFIRQQIVASVAKWVSLYTNNSMLLANFEWANKKLNTRFEPKMSEPDEEIDDSTTAADHIASKSAPSTKHSNAGAGKAQTGDQPSSSSKSASAFKGAPKLSENIEKIRQSIRTAIETTEWSDQPTSQQAPQLVRRGSFSSFNPGAPLGNSESATIDEKLGRMDFLGRSLQQVPSLMALNDITLESIYNMDATANMEDLADDIEVLQSFQEDVQAISGWNIMNKDNDEHLVLLQCSYLFSETARLWKKKLSGADKGNLALDAARLMRPSSADKKKHGILDTSAAREALTALEYKQTLEKRIHELNKEKTATQNDVMRLHATLAETEFIFQKKTATFEETIAELLDEVQSLKADFETISKIPREKILLWALKEKESVLQFRGDRSDQENYKELSSSQEDASKHERSLDHLRNEAKMQTDKCNKLEIAFEESQEQLKKSQDKLRLKTEEVLLMQLKVKESGGQQGKQGKQTELSSYILKLEDTVTSLSEELSSLKDDLVSAKDLSQSRLDEMSSQVLLRHQKRFLSDRNALIDTHGRLMVSMARMSNNFSTEIRAQLSIMRENISKTQQLLKSDVAEATQKLLLYQSPSSAQKTNQKTQNYSTDVKQDPSAASFSSDRVSSVGNSTFLPVKSPGASNATTSLSCDTSVSGNTLISPKKEKSFFSSLFGKASQTKSDGRQLPKSLATNSQSPSESIGNISATAHLKTVFASAKGAVEAEEAMQSKLAAEAHAAALAKVEEEWQKRAAAATVKVEAKAVILKGMEAVKQTADEANVATETNYLTHVNNVEELEAAYDVEVAPESKPVVEIETSSTARERGFGDVSGSSDDSDLYFERDDKSDAESKTNEEKSAALVQAIVAATLAMTKPHIAVISNETAVIRNVSIDEGHHNARNTFIPHEGNVKLYDRPASAEAIGSSLKQSGNKKSLFLNNVLFEDASDSMALESSVVSKVTDKSGRKLLKGTSKTIADKNISPKEAFIDTDYQPMSSKGQHDELGHVATAVLSVPSVEKKIRLSRVSAGNRMIPAPQSVKATNEDHQPTTTVVYSAAESLKKMKGKLAKAQMPKDLENLAASRSVSTAAEENESLKTITQLDVPFGKEERPRTEKSASSLLESPHYHMTASQEGLKLPESAMFIKSPSLAEQTVASVRRDLEDWNVEDL